MKDRRAFLKQILGAGASVVVAPVVKLLPKKVVGDFSKIMIPMVRRVYPELIIKEIVDVQPMSGPVGLAFALNYVYTEKKLPWWKKIFKLTDKLLHVKKH
jgi:hypothetical protein